jgi:ribosomal protein S18 acetylase RimI-like enzyme
MTSIEPLAREDVDAVCSLARLIWRAHYPPIIGVAQTEYMLAQRYDPETVRSELEREGVWWDVLREDGAIVAFASSLATETADELKLDKLYVHPERQRRGYGGMLIAEVCRRARALAFSKVVLAVNKNNAGAIAAYAKHGFHICDVVKLPIGGGFFMDDYIMQLPVGL